MSRTAGTGATSDQSEYRLAVVGGGSASWSLLAQAGRAGLRGLVLVTTQSDPDVFDGLPMPDVKALNAKGPIEVRDARVGHGLTVASEEWEIDCQVVVVDAFVGLRSDGSGIVVPAQISGRLHTSVSFEGRDQDVLLVGDGDLVGPVARRLSQSGARVVAAITAGREPMSSVARLGLERLELDQRTTVLWYCTIDSIWDVGGFPMVSFADRRTPDLQFDQVVDLHLARP